MKRNSPRQHRRYPAAFSLLEMVIVLGVIALILAAAIRFADGITTGARITATEAKIREIASKLESYRNLAGHYPSEEQGLSALVSKPASTPSPRRWVQQFEVLPEDPWNHPYVYRYPGSRNTRKYEVLSMGDDESLGTDDDISSQDP